jgi:hypothetical protein
MSTSKRVSVWSAALALIFVLTSWVFYRAGAGPDALRFPLGLFADHWHEALIGKRVEQSVRIPLQGIRTFELKLQSTDLLIETDEQLQSEAVLSFVGNAKASQPIVIERTGERVSGRVEGDGLGLSIQIGSLNWVSERQLKLTLPARAPGAELKLEAASADIAGKLPRDFSGRIQTASGDLALKLGEWASGSLEIGTASGDVALFFGAQTPALELQSSSGEITLNGKWNVNRHEGNRVSADLHPSAKTRLSVTSVSGSILLEQGAAGSSD